jgi:hypothetical protein
MFSRRTSGLCGSVESMYVADEQYALVVETLSRIIVLKCKKKKYTQ